MNVNHTDIVQHAYAVEPAAKTVAGALEFLLRVLDVLPAHERAGLLLKETGENIAIHDGFMVSVGRVCYPDGQLYKILTDIPTTNGPQWAEDGTVDPARYLALKVDPPPPPPPPPPVEDRPDVLAAIDVLTVKVDAALSLLQKVLDRPFPDYGATGTVPKNFLLQQLGLKAGDVSIVLKPKP